MPFVCDCDVKTDGSFAALILTSARGCRFDPPLIITKPHSSQPRSSRFLSAVLSFILHLVMTQFEIFILSNFNFKLLFVSITFLSLFSHYDTKARTLMNVSK